MIGQLVAIAVAGLAGLTINARVKCFTDRVLQNDVELEDRGSETPVILLTARGMAAGATDYITTPLRTECAGYGAPPALSWADMATHR